MDCGYGNMCRIRRCLRWDNGMSNERLSQRGYLVGHFQLSNAVEQSKAFFRCLTIPTPCLVDHQL